jgi:hypothetical protein
LPPIPGFHRLHEIASWLGFRGCKGLDEARILDRPQALDDLSRDEARMIRIAITRAAFDAIAATMLFKHGWDKDERLVHPAPYFIDSKP